jgi:hypothetical protein
MCESLFRQGIRTAGVNRLSLVATAAEPNSMIGSRNCVRRKCNPPEMRLPSLHSLSTICRRNAVQFSLMGKIGRTPILPELKRQNGQPTSLLVRPRLTTESIKTFIEAMFAYWHFSEVVPATINDCL